MFHSAKPRHSVEAKEVDCALTTRLALVSSLAPLESVPSTGNDCGHLLRALVAFSPVVLVQNSVTTSLHGLSAQILDPESHQLNVVQMQRRHHLLMCAHPFSRTAVVLTSEAS